MSIRKFIEKYDIAPWQSEKSIDNVYKTYWGPRHGETTVTKEIRSGGTDIVKFEKYKFGLKGIHVDNKKDKVDRSSQFYDIVKIYNCGKSINKIPRTRFLTLSDAVNETLPLLNEGILALHLFRSEIIDLKNQTDLIYLELFHSKVKNIPCSVTTIRVRGLKPSTGINFSKLPLLKTLIVDGKFPKNMTRKNLPNLKVFVYNDPSLKTVVPQWISDEEKAGTLLVYRKIGSIF